jgi:hypothetical protein
LVCPGRRTLAFLWKKNLGMRELDRRGGSSEGGDGVIEVNQ